MSRLFTTRNVRIGYAISAVVAVSVLFAIGQSVSALVIAFGFACWCGGVFFAHTFQSPRST